MKRFILISLILTLSGCSKTDDDTNNICSSDCTILQGRFITMDNEGINGANLAFEFIRGGGYLPTYTRLISDLVSDENGNFYDEFYLEDSEIDSSSSGSLILRVNESSLNIIDNIITPDLTNTNFEQWLQVSTRDTIIEQTYYMPKKANIVVNLNNFFPILENDRFEVRSIFPYGSLSEDGYNEVLETNYYATLSREIYGATEINNSLNVVVAENENNIIRVYKTKNGIYTYEDVVINIDSSSPDEITLEY